MIAFSIFLLFVLLFFPSYPIQVFAGFALGVVMVSRLYAEALRRSISVRREQDRTHTYRLQPTTLRFVISNTGLLPVGYLSFADGPGGLTTDGDERTVFALAGRRVREHRYTVRGMNRGEYTLGPMRVSFADPLGLFPQSIRIDAPAAVVVYPITHRFQAGERFGIPPGDLPVDNVAYEDVSRYRSVREYVPGDPLKRIEWKSSARTGRLRSLTYERTISTPTVVMLNMCAPDYVARHRYARVERTVEAVASAAVAIILRKQGVGLVCRGKFADTADRAMLPIGTGPAQALLILTMLARVRLLDRHLPLVDGLAEVPHISHGSTIAYFGPVPREDDFARLQQLPRHGFHVVAYLVEEESPDTIVPRALTAHGVEVRRINATGSDIVGPA